GPLKICIVATLALLGSAGMTSGIGLLGARVDQRALLMAASGLMVATGLALAASGTYAIVVVALVGMVNPSSGSVSMFVPVACRRCCGRGQGPRPPSTRPRRGLAHIAGRREGRAPSMELALGLPVRAALSQMDVPTRVLRDGGGAPAQAPGCGERHLHPLRP